MLLGLQLGPSSFFVNFDFSYFFVFFENEQYQHRLNEKNQWFKNNALKVERVPNIFENLNYFETMLKMLKMMQMY
jgi:hypothetical protein